MNKYLVENNFWYKQTGVFVGSENMIVEAENVKSILASVAYQLHVGHGFELPNRSVINYKKLNYKTIGIYELVSGNNEIENHVYGKNKQT